VPYSSTAVLIVLVDLSTAKCTPQLRPAVSKITSIAEPYTVQL
jgi:hypothetical protein